MHMDMNKGGGGCKKRKRGDKVFKFWAFCEPGYPSNFDGPFHRNIRALLEFGHLEDSGLCGGMQSWSFQLELYRHPPVIVSLFVVEEAVEKSRYRRCNQCRYVGIVYHALLHCKGRVLAADLRQATCGWGHHMICNRRYHLVVPSKETLMPEVAHSRCKGSEAAAMMNWVELKGHLMHGLIHSNGFGHLLSLNGIETGSDFLNGHQIMDLWDRICTALRARKVSLLDVAKKRSMDLRLIHGVAYGEPWFGRWGYVFGRGSYGVTQQMHHKAIQTLQAMPLSLLPHHLPSSYQEISILFARYRTVSGNSLQTLGQLLHFMLELKARLPPESPPPPLATTCNHAAAAETACRWSSKRVEMAARVIVESLRKAEFRWVSRQQVRDAARAYIGDTGLLDYVLKSLGNHIVGNYIVRRALNPVTKVLEYCLEDISNVFPNPDGYLWPSEKLKTKERFQITRVQLTKDLFYLYKQILKQQQTPPTSGIFTTIATAARIILDAKHLIKDYNNGKIQAGDEDKLKLSCTVRLADLGEREEMIKEHLPPIPHELVILPAHASIEELKREVERNFREIYWGLRDFVAESVQQASGGKDSDLIYAMIETGSSLVVRGRSVEWKEEMREGGEDEWIVDCACGAKEDDGEGMIACDICEVRKHRRCVEASEDEVPQVFLCSECEHNILVFPSPLL